MPSYAECVNAIQLCLGEVERDPRITGVTEDADLLADVGLASIEVMELIESLEDTLDIVFPLNDLADLRTVADLAERLQTISG